MYYVLLTALFLMVAPFWAAMILAPGRRFTDALISSPLITVPPAMIYAALVVPNLGTVVAAVLSNDVGSIGDFLGSPEGTTIAWAHFLAGDLFLGRWMCRDMRRRGQSPLIGAPILILSLMLAPLGLLAHIATGRLATSHSSAIRRRILPG